MLADAVRAESYRLAQNRTALFWSVLFVPLISLALSTATFVFTKANEAALVGKLPPELAVRGGPLNLGDVLIDSVGDFANPAVLMFVLIGAATLYAGDYRWETWRLISARNRRTNLVLGKLIVVAGVILAATLAVFVADVASGGIRALVFNRPLAFSVSGEGWADIGQLALLSWARILQFTMMALLAATVTRSLLAALFAPLVIGVAQFFLPQLLAQMGVSPDSWIPPLVSPGFATDLIKTAIQGGLPAAGLPDQAVTQGVISLLAWTALPFAAAVAWFNRQDLSKE